MSERRTCRVFGFELGARGASHGLHFLWMRPCPRNFCRKIVFIARSELQPLDTIVEKVGEPAVAGGDDWNAAGISLRQNKREIFVTNTRNNQEFRGAQMTQCGRCTEPAGKMDILQTKTRTVCFQGGTERTVADNLQGGSLAQVLTKPEGAVADLFQAKACP